MDISLDRRACVSRNASQEIRKCSDTPLTRMLCEQHGQQAKSLNIPGLYTACPTGDSEEPYNEPDSTRTQIAQVALQRSSLWVNRPAAVLSSTYAMTPWGKILLWTLAILGCIDNFNAAEAILGSKGNDDSPALVQAHMTSWDDKFRSPRLAEIHHSLFESASETSEEDERKSLPKGEGKKKAKRPHSRKLFSSWRRRGKGNAKDTSQENLLPPTDDESEAIVDASSSSSESSTEGQGNKKKKGLLSVKAPFSLRRRGKRNSRAASREALISPDGDTVDSSNDESTTEGSSTNSLKEGEKKMQKKKGLKGLKKKFSRRRRGTTNPLSTSQENLLVSGSDESEGEIERPIPSEATETPLEEPKKKRSLLKPLKFKGSKRQDSLKRTTGLGVAFDARGLTEISDIKREVLGNFATSLSEQAEVFEAIEAATADGELCLKAVADADQRTAGHFPQELQSVRQGLLIYTACERLLDELKQINGTEPNNILDGILSLPTPGRNVKVLDDFLQASEPVFSVQSVDGQSTTLEGIEKTVDASKLILAPNPVEVGFVDTTLNGSWHTLHDADPELFVRFLDFATQNGYRESLDTGRKTGNFGGLIHSLKTTSSVFRILVGVRQILAAPIPEYPTGKKASKKWKDISAKYSIFSAVDAAKMIEILQIVLLQHSLPGCLALNAASLMMQPSLLLARLLERYMAGSPLMGPVGQQIDDNPVIRAYVPSTASPIQEIGRSTQLRSQCLAGVFSELGLNGASVENLTCHSLWKNERRVKGHHAYSPSAHTFSHVMRSVCSMENPKKGQAGLLPRGSLSNCNTECLLKAALRKDWADKATEKRRKAYRLRPRDTRIGDALRMASYYSSDELVELDQKIAAAWLVGKLLLAASRGRPNSVSASVSPEVEAGAGPSIRAPPETEGAETGSSANSQGDVDASLSSETKSASLLEDTRKRSHRNHGQNIIPNDVHDFVVGGNVNVNAINLIATANVCRALLDTDLTNPMLFASSVITNVRGYVNDSGAGMESAGKQRKLAKGSDVFAAVYKWLLCGFGGELLAPVFAPYASVAMQIGTFLRVELEESEAFPWEKIVQTMGDGVFSASTYASALKHLQKKTASFLEMFTPCVAEVEEALDLLMPSDTDTKSLTFAKRLKRTLKRTKGKRQRVNGDMCEISADVQQLARLLVTWWVLGPSTSESKNNMTQSPQSTASTFKGARLVFAFLIFNNGHDQAKIAMELVTAGCKANKFQVPSGWALASKKERFETREVSFKDISKEINASLMYLNSSLGSRDISDWLLPMMAAQALADLCAKHPVVHLGDLVSSEAGSMILMGQQCIKLQDEGIRLISKVLGKRSKTPDEGYTYVLFQFLKGINAWNAPKGSAGLSQAFGKYASSSEEADKQAVLDQWNGSFPTVECPWKKNERAQNAMIGKGTSYQKPAPLPVKATPEATEFHCPAHAPIRIQDLAEVPQPAMTQYCTGDSAQCLASDYDSEMQRQL